jgi:molybdate transport system ATP-binding protein
MSAVIARDIVKKFGEVPAVDGISLNVPDGEFMVLLGPSGCGKTTFLRIICGLELQTSGDLLIGGKVVNELPPRARGVAMMFQSYGLYPHYTVRNNIAFPLKTQRMPREKIEKQVEWASQLLGIGHLLDRRPSTLSGGEKQRIAIGRALLADPQLLLMDEPLASLDEARKAEIYPYIERLRDEGGIPIVLVSHSVAEIARLATSIVMLSEGRVTASGSAPEILRHTSLFAQSGPAEAGALIEARVLRHEGAFELTVLQTKAGFLTVPLLDRPVGATLRVRLRARDIILSLKRPEGLSALNVLPGKISSIDATGGPSVDVMLDCGGDSLVARVTRKSVHELGLVPDLPIHAIIKSIAFDPEALGAVKPQDM